MAISDVGAPAAASGSTGNSIVINLAEEDMAENHDLTPEPIQPQTPDLATNVDEIRAALVAIARHLGVEVPRVTTPAVRVDTPRPSDDAYDEEAVVDLQLREVPSKAPPNIKVQQLTGEYYVRRRGRGLPPNWSVAVGSEESLDPSPGHQHAFAWDLPHGDRSLAFNSVTLWELGYDSQGYVDFKRLCRRPKLVEHIFVTAEGARLDPPWEEQRFGKEWFIRCGLELDPGQLGIVNSQAIEYSQLSRPCYSLLDRFVKAMVLGPKGARVDFCERR
ncbi:uncharacterized protein EI97DRAFT_51304 [Westerdykella ornata]|uniref:Uncharacterized protein n=1 Tax=Westerdykella ornata TaxID=318751 RepID=A0A6A6JID6_WESOR|nr:uncharacterized protein EI97DRAFT_51304 [Westerdykella ornata]KAF2276177.1 hypothetical protein EI97DRAFT_51304 [Westerdykella ornata]